jgi:hypothetical protein
MVAVEKNEQEVLYYVESLAVVDEKAFELIACQQVGRDCEVDALYQDLELYSQKQVEPETLVMMIRKLTTMKGFL